MKLKQLLLTALALTLPLAGAEAQQWTTNTLPSGLIAWWQAEGNYLDSAGAHNGGGGATFGPGRFGQTFQFNGVNQSVAIPDATGDLNDWTQFTLEAWVKLDLTADVAGDAAGRSIINRVGNANDQVNYNQGYQFGFAYNATWIFLAFNTNGQAWPGVYTTVAYPAPLPTNVWLHVAATYDHNAVKLYLNGVPQVTNVIGAATVRHSTSSFRIGLDDNANCPFPGSIDDVRVYNRGLTATEVAYLHAGPSPSGLAAWWSAEGNFRDSVGTNAGTSGGGVTFTNGRVGSAFQFVPSANSSVQFPNSPAFQPTNNQLTIAAWIKPDFASPNMIDTILEKRDLLCATEPYSFIFSVLKSLPGYPPGVFGLGMLPQITYINSTNRIPDDGQFHHVAVTYNGTKPSGNCTLYLDGQIAGGGNGAGPIPPTVAGPYIGVHRCLNENSSMTLDEVSFYGRELSPSEIVALYWVQGGQPRLEVQPVSAGVSLSWPLSMVNYQLRAATNLNGGAWLPVPGTPAPFGAQNTLSVPATEAQRFFRLKTAD